jgi:uncharacterized protein (DUF433 family)
MARQSGNVYGDKHIERTEHPYVVKVQGVASGEPIILGTGIMVRTVVEQYRLGGSIEKLLWDFPQLSSAQVHDALSYYHDHREAMNKLIAQATYEHWHPITQELIRDHAENLS